MNRSTLMDLTTLTDDLLERVTDALTTDQEAPQ